MKPNLDAIIRTKTTTLYLHEHSFLETASIMKSLCTFGISLVSILASAANAAEVTGKFAPPPGKVLVFIGQDNASVGGTAKYQNGYVDNVQIPGGITHYVYFSEGWTNKFGKTFETGSVAGLNKETEWAAGPMHQEAYLRSPTLARCLMHVSISMEGNCEDKVANGSFDHLIDEFVDFVRRHSNRPFLIRIGYEFDGSWNNYDPENFKKAFRRIVNALRKARLSNFATVLASSNIVKEGQFEQFDPGQEYYDWVGYSWWGGDNDAAPALKYARKVGKPVFIAEATPRGHFFNKEAPRAIWNTWFEKFFSHIEKNKDVVRAISYINADWDAQQMWDGWGQTRIETVELIKQKWLEKMAEPTFINAADNPFKLIGFHDASNHTNTFAHNVRGNTPAYKNPSFPIDARVEDLLERMTLPEKIGQITGWWHHDERKLRDEKKIFSAKFYSDICPDGIGELGPLHNLTIVEDAKQYAAVQDFFRRQTRLGIPAILHDEAAHGLMKVEATSFPAPIALSCTWNPDLLERIFSHAAREARSRGITHVLSPVVDVARELRWGRVDETLGEDPFLVGRLGAAMVAGLQGSRSGDIPADHVAATLKHFAGYADTEGGRNRSPYTHGERHLLDNAVSPFRHIIQATQPAAVMAAFNEVDGVPCHVNSWLLRDVLREKLGFAGLVVGDYQGIDLIRQYQNLYRTDADAGLAALKAGLQLELPNRFGFQHLAQIAQSQPEILALVDEAVRSVLKLKFSLGLFEAPFEIDVDAARRLTTAPSTISLCQEAARQSIVLLKNENRLLPLTPGAHKKIAVIGPNANVCRLGNYSGKPTHTVSLFQGIRDFVGDRAQVFHAEGCRIANNDTGHSYDNWRYVNEIDYTSPEDDASRIRKAVSLASDSDLIILALGESVLLSREAWGKTHKGDRPSLRLTASQEKLATEILQLGKPVILTLNNGKPIVLGEIGDNAQAILTLHYAGQETGTAAAEILFGKTSPSGKLTISWPQSAGHLPSHYNQHGSSQVFDYIDSPRSSVYPFGYGLSYSSFHYDGLRLSKNSLHPNDLIQVHFQLTNTGTRRATEIAQVYVSGREFEIARPSLELKGFARVDLEAGESRDVTIPLHADDLQFHDIHSNRVLPHGKYLVQVGGSSENLTPPLTLNLVSTTIHPAKAQVTPVEQESISQGSSTTKKFSVQTVAYAKPIKKPNVLFIAVDDLRPELGCYGHPVKTPHLDRLAASGILFSRAYCQQAVCGASRLSIMGGLYPTKTKEQSFHVHDWRKRHPDLLTLNQHFGEQGYQTVGLGKIYHGHRGSADTDQSHWDRWIDIQANDYALAENLELLQRIQSEGMRGSERDPAKGPMTESADVGDETYPDGKRALSTQKLLADFAGHKDAKPFFLAVGFTKPHLPFSAPKKYWDLYQRDDFSMPANTAIPPGYPEYAANPQANEMSKYVDYAKGGPKAFPNELNKKLLHGYAAATSYVDACVGRVLDTLDDTGLSENTIVVLWGDHGWKLGDHSSWCKHTNFECDTRVPLIIRDPRVQGGKRCERLVELIDLYPTLCELTGIETPTHVQGRSFCNLLENPQNGHRNDAYSSYPAWQTMGHSLRFGNYRYTEWHQTKTNKVVARVLTDLAADPGEVTNVFDKPTHAEAAARGASRLAERMAQAARRPQPRQTTNASSVQDRIQINPSAKNLRQQIDGFGGSVAFWATAADDESLKHAVHGLRTNIIRVQGEVTKNGLVDHNVALLKRVLALNPNMQVLLTFWQPRSEEHPDLEYWLNEVLINNEKQYVLRHDREREWADEMVSRVRYYVDQGIPITQIGAQNESNWSHQDTQTCRWEPPRLKSFLEEKIKPRLLQAGLNHVEIVAPDLAFVGPDASELQRFRPVTSSSSVDIIAYHMYDSFSGDMDGSLDNLVANARAVRKISAQHAAGKRLWMTETTGAQWNSDTWHTFGWTPELTDHQKAIKAARYMHMTFVDAQANAFLWWGLIYSLAPDSIDDPNVRQKHRDEGLVLVKHKWVQGRQPLAERTKKYFVFRQFSGYVQPGFRRFHIEQPDNLQLSAFQNPHNNSIVAVAINDTKSPRHLHLVAPTGMYLSQAIQTDEQQNCQPVDKNTPMPPESIRTLIYQATAVTDTTF